MTPDKRQHFESIGPAGVKREMAEGRHGQAPDSANWRTAELWVESELLRREGEAEERREAREERMLSIAASALDIAKDSAAASARAALAAERQAAWARFAAMIAAIAAVIAIAPQIKEIVMNLLQK